MITEKELKRIEKSMDLLKDIKKKFIINETESRILQFWNSLKCSVCGKYPTQKNKNYRIVGEIYCKRCKGRLFP